MRTFVSAIILAGGLLVPFLRAHEVPIETPTEFYLEAGRVLERPIALVFDDDRLTIRERQSRQDLLTLVYSEISKMRYEHAAQPQILGESPVPSSEETRHWLTFRFRKNDEDQFLLLSLDPYDYTSILQITQMLTGIKVEGAPGE